MEEEITIDLRELAHIVQKNARVIAKVTGGCIVAAGLYLLTPAIYHGCNITPHLVILKYSK